MACWKTEVGAENDTFKWITATKEEEAKEIWNEAIEKAASCVKNNNKLMCKILKEKK